MDISVLWPGGSPAVSYQIARSLRFRSSASASLTRTTSAAGSQVLWLNNIKVKRGALGSVQGIYSAWNTTGGNAFYVRFNASDQLEIGQGATTWRASTRVFRDPGAHFSLTVLWDSNNATAQNRCRVWVDDAEIISWATNNTISSGQASNWNASGQFHVIGAVAAGASSTTTSFDGVLSDAYHGDGVSGTYAAFGALSATTPSFDPIAYAGTYGTNGFHLDFSDNSAATAAAIGADRSGNGNNWTPSGISVTAGTTNDSLVDTPTNYGTDTGAGAEVRGNYPTASSIRANASITLTDGGLTINGGGTAGTEYAGQVPWGVISTDPKVYYEVTMPASIPTNMTATWGWCGDNHTLSQYPGATSNGAGIRFLYVPSTFLEDNGVETSLTPLLGVNDVIGVAFDPSTKNVWFSRNGTWYNSGNPAAGTNPAVTLSGAGPWYPAFGTRNSCLSYLNFGQRPFAYTAPTGFKALCTQNLATPTIIKPNTQFDTALYTGNGTGLTVTNAAALRPDLVWIKTRSAATQHVLTDSVRGANEQLFSSSTAAEQTDATHFVTAFNSNGFSLGAAGGASGDVNTNAATYVSWQWKKGVTPGFDIVSYTGNGAASTVAHSLGAVPALIIARGRTAISNWQAWHRSMSIANAVQLNLTNAQAAAAAVWNSTLPTSSVFSLGTNTDVNNNGTASVAYLWAEVPGFSKFGNYTGNGAADGPFVWCGFRPRWIMIKCISSTSDWYIIDTARLPYNAMAGSLSADTTSAEGVDAPNASHIVDALSNGFKLRGTGGGINAAQTYIFAVFAEAPFKYARGR